MVSRISVIKSKLRSIIMSTCSCWQNLLLNCFGGFQIDLFELINWNLGFLAHFLLFLSVWKWAIGAWVKFLCYSGTVYCIVSLSLSIHRQSKPRRFIWQYTFSKENARSRKRPSFFKWSKHYTLYAKSLFLVKFVLGLSVRLRRRRWRRSIGWLIDYTNFKFFPNKLVPCPSFSLLPPWPCFHASLLENFSYSMRWFKCLNSGLIHKRIYIHAITENHPSVFCSFSLLIQGSFEELMLMLLSTRVLASDFTFIIYVSNDWVLWVFLFYDMFTSLWSYNLLNILFCLVVSQFRVCVSLPSVWKTTHLVFFIYVMMPVIATDNSWSSVSLSRLQTFTC